MSISQVLNSSISQEAETQKSNLGKIYDHPELVHKVCSYLATTELEVVVCLNKKFCEYRIEAIRFYTPRLQKEFIGSCVFRLNAREYDVLASKLEAIKGQIDDGDCQALSLKDIALYISRVKRSLSYAVKDIPDECVYDILPSTKPWHMDNLPLLIGFERRIDQANQKDDPEDRGEDEYSICESMLENGLFNRAIDFASCITEPSSQYEVQFRICRELSQDQRFEEAINFSKTITNTQTQVNVFVLISESLAQAEHFEEAINFASTIPLEYPKNVSLMLISIFLARAGRFVEADNLADTIIDNEYKDEAFVRIAACKNRDFGE